MKEGANWFFLHLRIKKQNLEIEAGERGVEEEKEQNWKTEKRKRNKEAENVLGRDTVREEVGQVSYNLQSYWKGKQIHVSLSFQKGTKIPTYIKV